MEGWANIEEAGHQFGCPGNRGWPAGVVTGRGNRAHQGLGQRLEAVGPGHHRQVAVSLRMLYSFRLPVAPGFADTYAAGNSLDSAISPITGPSVDSSIIENSLRAAAGSCCPGACSGVIGC